MTPSTVTPAALRAVGVDVALGGVPILRKVSFEVGTGQMAAIVGNNGSGKTTAMRAVLGLIPHDGLIEIFGTDLGRFSDWPRIGYVPQRGTVLVQQATAREVVASGRLGRRRPFWPASRQDRQAVSDALIDVGLPDRAGHPFARLSGGQQQRILIARAIAGGADLMVWDEPLAGVDHTTQDLLAGLAGRLKAEGRTIIMVLHELGPFAPLIDTTITLADGRIAPSAAISPSDHHHDHQGTVTTPHEDRVGLEVL